ncbi:MAG: hypothetical protein GTO55_04505 [Armatimonadetes bacterium]|nr:hypothetical protein [Armatimonadota bacterium]NIM23528.1 hypothetical protein [Armatimonadota bacterium]NIM67394.1 hypothetical protein [Armatimonadota bacterium]NIM75895.1 hypothetical protein [Armatimonadota bacterium]NIN05580.1 hypothetical protein [Armatimonadota bacterium]
MYPRAFSGVFVALVYVAFGLMDMVLSLAAFSLGISEGNPFLAWVEGCGLFLPTKVFLTAVAGILIGLLYPHARTRPLTHCALGIMAFVNAYHVWALNVLLPAG